MTAKKEKDKPYALLDFLFLDRVTQVNQNAEQKKTADEKTRRKGMKSIYKHINLLGNSNLKNQVSSFFFCKEKA